MSDIVQLVELMQKPMDKQEERIEKQEERHSRQMEVLFKRLENGSPALIAPAASVPSFAPFNPTSELWNDYQARFYTFVGTNSISEEKIAQVFLTNQTTTT